jgi:demethylmenaquinone methyltransferase/2-methoxy-6-polyprenyl-1,4-benzoquinol methylase
MARRLSSAANMPVPRDAPPLRSAFDTPDEKRRYVRRLFGTIADRYDLITVLLSCGMDRRWKRRLVALAPAGPGTRALDLACGTGDIAFALAQRGAKTTGLDITRRMLEIAAAKRTAPVALVAGDMMSLPFADSQFDVVTAGYGIRNVPRIEPALAEIHRILRPGGVFLSLDFNRPASPGLRSIYLSYLTAVGSVLGYVLHRDPDTYRYIPESIRRYPGAEQVCRLARAHGFARCEWYPVLGGLMAIHRASRAG